MKYIDLLISRYPTLGCCEKKIEDACECMIESFENNGKLLIAGNGGSAADALHIVGELMKGFVLPRKLTATMQEDVKNVCNPEHVNYLINNLQQALPAIALVENTGLSTAFANDNAPDLVFAQQVLGYGNVGDVFFGISTSGNSKNVLYAMEIAKARGLKTIALTGKSGGKLKRIADICITVPETETYKIQELHLPIYHAICLALEEEFFGGSK